MLAVTAELKRVLKPTGTMWWNHGDSYGGTGDKGASRDPKYPDGRNGQSESRTKGFMPKCLLLQAHRLAIRMIDEQGWMLRNIIIWHKPNGLPNPVQDRFPVDYEPVFFFTKSRRYWFEKQYEPSGKDERLCGLQRARLYGYDGKGSYQDCYLNRRRKVDLHPGTALHTGFARKNVPPLIRPLGRSKRTVWRIATKPYAGAHFAAFPPALVETPIKAGCPVGGIVLDPFMGSGTTALVAKQLGRQYLGIELNREYIKLATERVKAA